MTTTGTTRAAAPRTRRPWVLLTAVVLAALNLRTAVAAVPPLLETIATDLRLSATAAGMLTTLPLICMAVFAPVAATAAARVGRERALSASLGLVALGSFVRGAEASTVTLFAGTLLAGVGIAVGTALLPGVVKAWFPDKAGSVTGLYTMSLVAGAMLAAAVTVPLSTWLGSWLAVGWPPALGAWGLAALAAILAWGPVTHALHDPSGPRPPAQGLPWRSGVAWRVSIYMGGQSLLYFTPLTWLAPLYVREGWPERDAGLLLALFSLTQLVSALTVPALSDRTGGDRRPWIALCLAVTALVFPLVALMPTSAPWLYAAVLGLTIGGMFALALSLLVDLAPTPLDASRLSGMAFLVGYLLAATGPVVAGVLIDVTGGFAATFLALAGISVLVLLVGVSVGPSSRV